MGWAEGLVPLAPLEPLPTGMSRLPPVLREVVGAASALQPALSLLRHVPLLAGEGATLRCCKKSPFCRSAGNNRVTCAHQYPTGKASVVDLCWAPARQEALAHHLLLLGMLQALGNPLSCGGTKHTEANPSAELGAASSPHCQQKWGLPVRAGLSILAQSGSSAALELRILDFITLAGF